MLKDPDCWRRVDTRSGSGSSARYPDFVSSSARIYRIPWTHRRVRRTSVRSLRSATVRTFCRGHGTRWQSASAGRWRSRATSRATSNGWRIAVYRCAQASTRKRSSRPARPAAPASCATAATSPISTCVPRREVPPELVPRLIASCRCVALRCGAVRRESAKCVGIQIQVW